MTQNRRGGGATKSPMRLGERRRKATELFVQGYSITEVAKQLKVSVDTASRYKKAYEDQIREQAAANPHLLREVLPNTIRALEEIDRVREQAWKKHNETKSDQIKAQMLNIILKAQDQRAKLFGLLGVKQETLAFTLQVQKQQERLIEYMKDHLCPADRAALDEFIVQEFSQELDRMPTAPDGA